jgi:long-subunit acyl-CoA synthetase (AMP-forming)
LLYNPWPPNDQDKFNINEPKVPGLKHLVYYDTIDITPGVLNFTDIDSGADSTFYKILDETKVLPSDIGNIQFTSGTTGQPKAAALSHFG